MNSQEKSIVKSQIKSSIQKRIGSDAYSAYVEIVDVLAYACTFKNPRMFSSIEMNERTWQDLASSITVCELQSIAASLNKFKSNNRIFYILGCLARTYARRKSSCSSVDYTQRRYTKADFARVITPISELANIEW